MKSLLGILAILISVSAQAAPTTAEIASAVEALKSSACLSALETAVATAAAVSDEQKAIINSNLNLYSNLLTQAQSNLVNKQSNEAVYLTFQNILAKHSNETYYGVETGAAVVGCLKRTVDLSPATLKSPAKIKAAQSKIESLKKAAI